MLRSLATSSSSSASAVAAAGSSSVGLASNVAGLATKAAANTLTVELKGAFTTHRCEGPATTVTTTKEELITFYKRMTLMRRMEMEADRLYKAGKIRGFCHLYIGQEAVAAGLEPTLDAEDHIITAYRAHCQQLSRGDTVKSILAELMGRVDGCSKGKGGSMHMYWKNFHGGNGIVGAQVPLGAGVALALKQQGKKNVCHAMYGDGASNQGQIFEAYNMAQLWKLPVIFICENNHFGMGTAVERAAMNTNFFERGDVIPGVRVDAMDVLATREAGRYARKYALEHGPIVLEMDTYRYQGHSMSDPGVSYRSREDVQAVRTQRDCIDRVANRLKDAKFATEEEIKEWGREIKDYVDAASAEAEKSPQPPAEFLVTDILADKPETMFIRNVEHATSWFPKV